MAAAVNEGAPAPAASVSDWNVNIDAIKFGFENSFNISEGFYNENDQNWKKNLPVKFI